MKYRVTVELTYRKELTVYAPDEQAAMEKAEAIASDWNNVEYVNAIEAEPDEE